MNDDKNDSQTFEIDVPDAEQEDDKQDLGAKKAITDKVEDFFGITQPKDTEVDKKDKEAKSDEGSEKEGEKSDSESGKEKSEKSQSESDSDQNNENKTEEDKKSQKSDDNEKNGEEEQEKETHEEEEQPELFQQLLDGTKTVKEVPPEQYKQVISQLTYYEKECKERYDVEGVAKCKQLEKEINERYEKKAKTKAYNQYKGKMEQRRENAQRNIENIEEKYKELLQNLQEKQSRELQQLYDKHSQELDNFDSNWESSQKVRRFTVASSTLRELRHVRRCIALTGDVARTKDTEMLEKQCEAKDIEEKSHQMYLQFEQDRQVLINKQQQKEKVLLASHEAETDKLNLAYKADMEAAQHRLQNIENSMKICSSKEVVWNTHFRGEKKSIPRPAATVKSRSVTSKKQLWGLTLPPLSQTRPSTHLSTRASRTSTRPSTAKTMPYKRDYIHFR